VRTVETEALDRENLAGYACLFLGNPGALPGQALAALEQYLRNGGTVMVFPGDRGVPADYGAWSSLPAKPLEVAAVPQQQAARLLRLRKPDDALFAGLRLPPGSTPALTVQRRMTFGDLEKDSDVLIEMGYDEPFLLSRKVGRGRLLFCALSADRAWSTLPLSPFFVPLVHRIAQVATGISAAKLYVQPGPLLDVTDLFGALPDASLISPEGTLHPVRRIREDNRDVCLLENIRQTGLYRLSSDKTPALAVNLSRTESDLSPIPARDLPRLPGLADLRLARTREELLQRVREHRIGTPLAEPFLWLALLVSILETLFAARAVRRTGRLTDHMTVDPSGRVRGTDIAGEAP
jgi:hypothetical protein